MESGSGNSVAGFLKGRVAERCRMVMAVGGETRRKGGRGRRMAEWLWRMLVAVVVSGKCSGQ